MHNLQKSTFWKHLIVIFPYFEIYICYRIIHTTFLGVWFNTMNLVYFHSFMNYRHSKFAESIEHFPPSEIKGRLATVSPTLWTLYFTNDCNFAAYRRVVVQFYALRKQQYHVLQYNSPKNRQYNIFHSFVAYFIYHVYFSFTLMDSALWPVPI
jgi:hypothetical protein